MPQISVIKVFDDMRHKLGLSWVAGKLGGKRKIAGEASQSLSLGLIDHLNYVHPNCVQVLGGPEITFLSSLSPEGLEQAISDLFIPDLAMIVVANDEAVPLALLAASDTNQVPLLTTQLTSPRFIELMRVYLTKVLAESTTLHGVFLDVLGIGLLITGDSAMGKSELALELISRGHGLVADDVVEIFRVAPEILEARCPPLLRDFLEVRGLGVLNIRTIFGETAVRPKKVLKLIVHLEKATSTNIASFERLKMNATMQTILGVDVRKVTIPVAVGRNLAVLAEAAVRNFILQLRGIDSTLEFLQRHQHFLDADGKNRTDDADEAELRG